MLSQREEGVFASVFGLAVIGFGFWFDYLAVMIIGAAYTAICLLLLAGALRGGQTYHQYDTVVRWIWSAIHQLPDGQELTDPSTGATLTVERDRGRTILAVRSTDQDPITGTVTRYVVGSGHLSAPPPLLSHTAPTETPSPLRGRWVLFRLFSLNVSTGGAMQVSTAEVVDLWAQLVRALGLEYRPRS
jgi:hypothetical protein